MKDAGFIIASYVVTFAGIGLFSFAVLRRSRSAARDIRPEDRPWS